ncbi:MAG: DUF4215 domain-containing protein [Candidatus Binatia bacterium]
MSNTEIGGRNGHRSLPVRAYAPFAIAVAVACGIAVACAVLLGASTASAATSFEIRCRGGIETGLTEWVAATIRARQGCLDGVVSGYGGSQADCLGDGTASSLRAQLDEASSRLRARIESSCAGANWGLLSYPGPCAEEGSVFSAETLAACVENLGSESVGRFVALWYPAEVKSSRGAEAECVRAIPKKASKMVIRELRTRLRCLLQGEKSGSTVGVDCRGQLPPYGAGTLDSSVDRKVYRAYKAWLSGMPRPCAIADFAAMGYGQDCPYPLDLGAGLVQYQACVFRQGRLQVPLLLDLAFPSDPVCGNGILQEGEECDNGPANSDTTANACRLDCVLPICGDSTTDPANGETCDDGDFENLDGCTENCEREFCGDGIVNNLPQEVCDDGNQNPNDRCTGTCKVAICGDGVVCNDASCTSGPGGGPELCDLGAANASGGVCDPNCSGFTINCTLKIGVTNTVKLGALTYVLSYANADGGFAGSGGSVQCTSLVTGGLVSFFENETRRTVKESLIVDAGFQAPGDIASCNYVTNDTGLSPADFQFDVEAAATPTFEPATATMAVTSLVCTP